jgi:hypothetical protein
MAVAKNLVVHGVWGVTPYEFSSSTTTILWPLLLALTYALGGTSELAPLFLNVLCGAAALLVVYVVVRKMGLPQGYQAVALLAVLFLAPLPAMIFSGMEHTLQIAGSLLFVYVVACELEGEAGARRGARLGLWLLAAALPLIRYEELFLVFAACVLFFARKRWQEALGLGLVAALPLAIYGAISAHHGWYWLPNSVCLKAHLPQGIGNLRLLPFLGYWDGWVASTDLWATVVALLGLGALLVYRHRTLWRMSTLMIAQVVIAAALHLKFGRFGVFFRYEAYLIALSVLVFVVGAFEYLAGRQAHPSGRGETQLAGMWLGYSLLLPFVVLASRGYRSLHTIPLASHNTYEQQYQMGLFLQHFYPGASIAANDIGAVSYLAEPRLEDLYGLGSLDVAQARMEDRYTPQAIDQLTRRKGTKIALLFDPIFHDGRAATGGLPAEWICVGRWKLFDKYVCAEDTVSFYAVDPSEEQALIAHLRQYAPHLPPEVEQSGKYRSGDRAVGSSGH